MTPEKKVSSVGVCATALTRSSCTYRVVDLMRWDLQACGVFLLPPSEGLKKERFSIFLVPQSIEKNSELLVYTFLICPFILISVTPTAHFQWLLRSFTFYCGCFLPHLRGRGVFQGESSTAGLLVLISLLEQTKKLYATNKESFFEITVKIQKNRLRYLEINSSVRTWSGHVVNNVLNDGSLNLNLVSKSWADIGSIASVQQPQRVSYLPNRLD